MCYNVEREETVFVSFRNALGITFLTQKIFLRKDLKEVMLNTSNLLTGRYFIKIYSSQLKHDSVEYTKDC